jgi:hypothetical protein
MTPQEKAKEIVDKLKPLCGGYWGGQINKGFAIQQALIMVDELINCTISVDGMPPNYQEITPNTCEYWQEVRDFIYKT